MTPTPRPGVAAVDGAAASLIDRTFAGLGAARVLSVAVQFGIFTRIAEGKRTAAEIARDAEIAERGARRLLNALVGLGFLTRAGEAYQLTAVAAEHLVRNRPFYLGQLMEGDWLWESWEHLPGVVRTGRPFRRVDQATDSSERFFKALVPTLHVANLPGARRAAESLAREGVPARGLEVLDIGCGSGVWSIALVEAAGPRVRVTAQDLPGVLEMTRRYVRLHGVEDQFEFLPGDQWETDLGTSTFDLVILARYVHELGSNAACALFRRVYLALRPGGRVAVADWVPNDDRTGPPGPLLYSLRMLLHTENGDAHTAEEYVRWLGSAGFQGIEVTRDVGVDVALIVGRKPS
jgi:ubiquinone/menaquinone biosynthesis C-methylase UbiE